MVPTPAGYNGSDEELDKPCPRLMESLISLERRKAVDGNDSTSSRYLFANHPPGTCLLSKFKRLEG
jgi:hypothetical protein